MNSLTAPWKDRRRVGRPMMLDVMDGHCLSQDQIRDLPEGTPVRVIWNGGSMGDYRVRRMEDDGLIAVHSFPEFNPYFDALWMAEEAKAGVKVPRAWVELIS